MSLASGRPLPAGAKGVGTAAFLAFGGQVAGKIVGKVAGALKGVNNISPSSIRFSQSSVNGVDDIAASMSANGWKGAPIDVVKMPDGLLTTVDNTRVLAADLAGIDVRAVVHRSTDALPAKFIERFTTRSGGAPQTWGNAVLNRIGNQNSLYRNTYPFGSPVTGVR